MECEVPDVELENIPLDSTIEATDNTISGDSGTSQQDVDLETHLAGDSEKHQQHSDSELHQQDGDLETYKKDGHSRTYHQGADSATHQQDANSGNHQQGGDLGKYQQEVDSGIHQTDGDSRTYQQEGDSRTHQQDLAEQVLKKGIYPDLNALNENIYQTYQNESHLNEQHSETSEMGCISDKERPVEPITELKDFHQFDNSVQDTEQSDNVQSQNVNKAKSDADYIAASPNDNVEKDQILNNEEEASDVCRPKEHVGYGSPIVSSFSAGPRDELPASYRAEEEENVSAGSYEEHAGYGKHAMHVPGRAVRVDNVNNNNDANEHIRENENDVYVEKGKYNSALDSSKEKKRRHRHDKKSDGKSGKEENKFRGIDQNWRTNDDDEWEQAQKEAEKKYEYFWRKHDIFSQWHYSVFFCETNKFTCAEQYMMYQKAILFGDCHIATKVLKAKDPPKMKSLGRKVRDFSDELWNANCLNIVKNANIAKFSQNKQLKEGLFATYPKILVEASPADAIWGIGCVKDEPDAWDESTWRGKNYLGYVITEVRDELMAEARIIGDVDKKVYLPQLIKQMQRSKEKVNMPEEETEV